MTITNLYNLPLPLVRAIQNDDYDPGDSDITVTQLNRPPRQVELERRHKAEIVVDASEEILALLGKIGHLILERSASGELCEHRFYVTRGGWKIGVRLDLWMNRMITDYKFVSGWSIKDGPRSEWVEQLNLEALICRENGINVDALQIVAILRDWSKLEAKRNPETHQAQVKVFDIPIWPTPIMENYLSGRINAHQMARIELPDCTSEERWERLPKFALMKQGRKRAVRLYDSLDAAKEAMPKGNGHFIELRPGEQVRCESYCRASDFCEQFKLLQSLVPTLKESIKHIQSED